MRGPVQARLAVGPDSVEDWSVKPLTLYQALSGWVALAAFVLPHWAGFAPTTLEPSGEASRASIDF